MNLQWYDYRGKNIFLNELRKKIIYLKKEYSLLYNEYQNYKLSLKLKRLEIKKAKDDLIKARLAHKQEE